MKKSHLKSRSLVALLSLVFGLALVTPAMAADQEEVDSLFTSRHIDDAGVRTAVKLGEGQVLNQTFYDFPHDITVHFNRIMTDDKETKLLLTYQSKTMNLKNTYLDIFEGNTSVTLLDGKDYMKMHFVGWGSRYYDPKKNRVAEALSFEPIKQYKGQDIHLEINNLTIYDDKTTGTVQTTWPLIFRLKPSAVFDRKTVNVNTLFHYKNEVYKIKQVEFSPFETRVLISGSDNFLVKNEDGDVYHMMSKLQSQYLHPRETRKTYGYTVNYKKSGVYLISAGQKADPIYSKGEIVGPEGELVLTYAPVKDPHDCLLEIENDTKIPLMN